MVHKQYVKRKKVRIIALISTGAFALAVTSFSIIAFIGKDLGDFTVLLNNDGPIISLDTTSEFTEPKTFYRVDKLPPFAVYTAEYIPTNDKIDNSETLSTMGNRYDANNVVDGIYYYKLTFYIKNTGSVVANYNINLQFIENVKPADSLYGLDDILRVRFFENTSDDHAYTDYAKTSKTLKTLSDGTTNYDEYLSDTDTSLCTPFETTSDIFNRKYEGLAVGDSVRYTLMFYLEGGDPECTGSKPRDTSLKLGLTFKTYVKQDTTDTTTN